MILYLVVKWGRVGRNKGAEVVEGVFVVLEVNWNVECMLLSYPILVPILIIRGKSQSGTTRGHEHSSS